MATLRQLDKQCKIVENDFSAVRHNPAKIYGVGNAGPRPKSAAAKLSELREKQRKERMEREKVMILKFHPISMVF